MAPSLLHKKEHSSPRNVGPVISKICRFAKTRPDSRFCPNLFWQRGVCGVDHQREAPQGITAQSQARQSNYKVLERRETSHLQPPAKDIPADLKFCTSKAWRTGARWSNCSADFHEKNIAFFSSTAKTNKGRGSKIHCGPCNSSAARVFFCRKT